LLGNGLVRLALIIIRLILIAARCVGNYVIWLNWQRRSELSWKKRYRSSRRKRRNRRKQGCKERSNKRRFVFRQHNCKR
jgi:hypothetical protein